MKEHNKGDLNSEIQLDWCIKKVTSGNLYSF